MLSHNVVTRTRRDDNTQRWVLTDWGNNEYTFQRVSSGRYLDAHEIHELDYRVVTRPERPILARLSDGLRPSTTGP